MSDPICPTCTKPITDEDAVMHHNCVENWSGEKQLNLAEAKQILDDYVKPSESIDIGNIYFAATEFECAYEAIKSRLTHIEQTLDQLLKDKLITQYVYKMLKGE